MIKHRLDVMIPESQLQERVAELGRQITAHYEGTSELVLIALLRGSCIFLADLARQIDLPVSLDFMTASSYGNRTTSSREVRVIKDLDDEIKGKDVLIVEDIIDSGFTLSKIREIIGLREPKSLAICTLLNKPARREVEVPVNWIGFTIPDEFVVGYGIDYAQLYRNLPYVGMVVPLEEENRND